jgi:hypothetical protein
MNVCRRHKLISYQVAIRFIAFHEKVFKLGFGFIWSAGDRDRASMRTRVFVSVQI